MLRTVTKGLYQHFVGKITEEKISRVYGWTRFVNVIRFVTT